MSVELPELEPFVIRTASGHMLDLRNPQADKIHIEDICIGLSRRFRFAAQTKQPYTVAQHCVNAMSLADLNYKFSALMHDAAEAYLGDVPAPIKKHITGFDKIEKKLMDVISQKFGFTLHEDAYIKQIDTLLLKHEWQTVVINNSQDVWSMDYAMWRFALAFENFSGTKVLHNIFDYEQVTAPNPRYSR